MSHNYSSQYNQYVDLPGNMNGNHDYYSSGVSYAYESERATNQEPMMYTEYIPVVLNNGVPNENYQYKIQNYCTMPQTYLNGSNMDGTVIYAQPPQNYCQSNYPQDSEQASMYCHNIYQEASNETSRKMSEYEHMTTVEPVTYSNEHTVKLGDIPQMIDKSQMSLTDSQTKLRSTEKKMLTSRTAQKPKIGATEMDTVVDCSPFMQYYSDKSTPQSFYEKTKQIKQKPVVEKKLVPVRQSKRNAACCGGDALDYNINSNVYSIDVKSSSNDRSRKTNYNSDMLWSDSDNSDCQNETEKIQKQKVKHLEVPQNQMHTYRNKSDQSSSAISNTSVWKNTENQPLFKNVLKITSTKPLWTRCIQQPEESEWVNKIRQQQAEEHSKIECYTIKCCVDHQKPIRPYVCLFEPQILRKRHYNTCQGLKNYYGNSTIRKQQEKSSTEIKDKTWMNQINKTSRRSIYCC